MPLTSDIITFTEARNNLKAVMDKVWNDSAPVIITRPGGKHVVVMNKDDYDSMDATAYLTSTKANARDMREALEYIESGKPMVRMRLNKKGKLVRAD